MVERWICNICGYIYDSNEGDSSQEVVPGTLFSELPEDWVCPECGTSIDNFTEIDSFREDY
mgnify:CR=1 FL=1|jgi:rubredoxin